eukprot:Hpha_TRINITY_DN17003_c3_g6::TRINITY_DN17003_c3_g6_i2::g.166188::m.166188
MRCVNGSKIAKLSPPGTGFLFTPLLDVFHAVGPSRTFIPRGFKKTGVGQVRFVRSEVGEDLQEGLRELRRKVFSAQDCLLRRIDVVICECCRYLLCYLDGGTHTAELATEVSSEPSGKEEVY